jgi:glycosyltransferase involved in cell wall biosynthesis
MRTFEDIYDPSTAVRTVVELRSQGVDATLTMAGQDNGLLEPTRKLARELGVADSVGFPGFVAGSAKADLFDDHDIFLNTNLVDNAPVTVLEAAASGLVVVSTDVGGIPDLLADGESALLLRAGDPAAVADAVVDLLDHPDQAVRLVDSARAVAQRSGWPSVRDRWLGLIAELARDREP